MGYDIGCILCKEDADSETPSTLERIIRASMAAACASFDGRLVPSRSKPALSKRKAADEHEHLFACEGIPSNKWPAELERAFRRFVRTEISMQVDAIASSSTVGRSNLGSCSSTKSGSDKSEPELKAKTCSHSPQEMKVQAKAYVPPHMRRRQAGQRDCPEMLQLQQ